MPQVLNLVLIKRICEDSANLYIRNELYSSKKKQVIYFQHHCPEFRVQYPKPSVWCIACSAGLHWHSSFEFMEKCTSKANGSLGLKDNTMEQNSTWPLIHWKKKGIAGAKGNAIALQAEEAE